MPHIYVGMDPTRLAIFENIFVFGKFLEREEEYQTNEDINSLVIYREKAYKFSFRVLAGLTENKFVNKNVQETLQLIRIMLSVDNIVVLFFVNLDLSSQFSSKD